MMRIKGAVALTLLVVLAAPTARAGVVISQVYGGAGCGTAGCSTYKNDYIELFNNGSTSVSLNGWSVQYSSAAGTTWQVTTLSNTTLQPGQYYLVAEGGNANGVSTLPTPDSTGTISMSATSGKVAVVNAATALSGACPTGGGLQDLVGFGSATCNEGGTNAPAPSTTTADLRGSNGCLDTNANGTDFTAGTPTPRNTATSLNSCSGAPTPTLSIAQAGTIAEGDSGTSTATFSVQLDNPAPAGGVQFSVNTVDGSASAGTDYVAIVGDTGSIAEGQTSASVLVTINGDTGYENDETFTVSLSNITNTTNATASAIGTITNDDPIPTISVADASVLEGDGGTSAANFAVTLDRTSVNDVTFFAQTVDGSATTADNDYVALPNTMITIPAGQIAGTIAVTVNGDTNIEGNETFTLQLATPNNGNLAATTATGTIQNDDAVTPTFSIDNVTHAEGDSGTTNFIFTVSSNVAAPVGGFTLTASTSDGSATAGEDYVAQSAPVTIAEGATSTTFTVQVNGDRKFEGDETFSVGLSNPPASTQISPTNGTGTGTISNDDIKPTLSIANTSIAEGDSGTQTLTFTVHLSAPALEGGASFDIATADGTATTADNDYVAKSLSGQTIAAGDQDASFGVTINGDTQLELDETFSVNVSGATGTANATASATGTITNDDAKPTLSVADASVTEGNAGSATLNFTVSLSKASPANVTFNASTANGTAGAPTDFTALSNAPFSITAGQLSTTVSVTVNGDTTTEADEAFALNLTGATNTANATASATGLILNDDGAATVMEIKGTGLISPKNTLVVSTHGVVTGKKSNGYFLQDPTGDGNLQTSDAVFVFTSPAALAVGDAVSVVAKVQQFNGTIELSNVTGTTVLSHGNPLPAPLSIDANPPADDVASGPCQGTIDADAANTAVSGGPQPQQHNFACMEAMLVSVSQGVVTGPTFGSGSDGVHTGTPNGFYLTLDGMPTPFREVGPTFPGLAGVSGPVFDGNPEVIEVYYPGLPGYTTSQVFDAGAKVSVTGVMQYFKASSSPTGIYEIYPNSPSAVVEITQAPSHAMPVKNSPLGTLTIGTQNLLHFFNDVVDGNVDSTQFLPPQDGCAAGSSDTCPTTAQYTMRKGKMARQVCGVLRSPAVLNVQEVENQDVIDDLADAVLAQCGVQYKGYWFQGNDPGGINVGILVRSDVTVNSVTQLYKNQTTTAGCSGTAPTGTPPCLINDRPSLLLDASYNGYPFHFLSIYHRSLSGLGDPTKEYVAFKRAEEATQTASVVQALQSGGTLVGAGNARVDGAGIPVAGAPFDITGDANVPLIIAGDFNAYQFTDGYVDVTGMIMGTAVQANNKYWDANYVAPSPTLVDSGSQADPADKYSFNFAGFRQEIDHILMSRRAFQDFVQISNSHGNSDVSEVNPASQLDTTPERSGDHDGQVLTLATDRIFADGFQAAP